MTGLQIGGAVAVLAIAFWIKRLASIGVYLKSAVMVIAVIAALVFLGVLDVGYNPDRIYEIGGWILDLVL